MSGVVVEEVFWSDGKHHLTKAYMLFLARWARKLSRKETAEAFHTSWEKVFNAVEYVVGWGLEHRQGRSAPSASTKFSTPKATSTSHWSTRSIRASRDCSRSAKSEPSKAFRNSSPYWERRSLPRLSSSARTCGSPTST